MLRFCTVQCDMILQHRNSHFSNWYFNSIFQILTSFTCFAPHWFILRKTVVSPVLYGMFTRIGVNSLAGIEHTIPPLCKTDDYNFMVTSTDLKRCITGDWSCDMFRRRLPSAGMWRRGLEQMNKVMMDRMHCNAARLRIKTRNIQMLCDYFVKTYKKVPSTVLMFCWPCISIYLS